MYRLWVQSVTERVGGRHYLFLVWAHGNRSPHRIALCQAAGVARAEPPRDGRAASDGGSEAEGGMRLRGIVSTERDWSNGTDA